MKLRRKIQIGIGLLCFGLGSLTYLVLQIVLAQHFRHLELETTRRRVQQARQAIQNQIDQVDQIAQAWAVQDETRQFVAGNEPDFAEVHLSDSRLAAQQLDWIVISNDQGEFLYATGFDLETQQRTPLSGGWQKQLTLAEVMDHVQPDSVREGVLLLPERLILLSSRPVLSPDRSVRGTVALGRILDQDLLDRIKAQLLTQYQHQGQADQAKLAEFVDLRLERLDRSFVSDEVEVAQQLLQGSTEIGISQVDDQTMMGVTRLVDLAGRPNLLLQIQWPRLIPSQYQQLRNRLMPPLFLGILLASGIALILIERLVMTRIDRLHHTLHQNRLEGRSRISLPQAGQDELADLAVMFNEVIQRLTEVQQRQRESEQRYRSVIKQSQASIFLVDAQSQQIIEANPAFETLLGYPALTLYTLPLNQITTQDLDHFDAYFQALCQGGDHPIHEQSYRHSDGSVVDVEVSVSRMLYNHRQVLCFVAHDIRDRKRVEAELRHHALHDILTGLPNRSLFLDRVEHALSRLDLDCYLAVLFVDLDSFKVINDSLGHHVGDELLLVVAQRLLACVRQGDTVTRFGGDEFVLLLEDLSDPNEATRIASRILHQLKRPIHLSHQMTHTTASIGVAVTSGKDQRDQSGLDPHSSPNNMPQSVNAASRTAIHSAIGPSGSSGSSESSGSEVQSGSAVASDWVPAHDQLLNGNGGITLRDRATGLLRDADTAMYRAKSQGKGCYALFDRKMHQQAMQRLQLEADLRRAIEQQELQLFYQPIVLLSTGQITGFEALIRWYHPTYKWLSPGRFLPIAEETGLIIPLDRWVLQEAQHQLQAWKAEIIPNLPLTISVNLSGKQFSEQDFLDQIIQILSAGAQAPNWLKFEITESLITQDETVVSNILWQLRDLGICLSIDDFGTGYSSLSRLQQFPIDTLKIDRSFISSLRTKGQHRSMVQSIVALAHSLDMDVVAEGIETTEQLQQLQDLECKYGQGYLFSRPVDSRAAGSLLIAQYQSPQTIP